MSLPESPIYCEICKANTIHITQIKQSDDSFKDGGMFVLPNTINGKRVELHPVTAICEGCYQVKIFLKLDGSIEAGSDLAKKLDLKFGSKTGSTGIM